MKYVIHKNGEIYRFKSGKYRHLTSSSNHKGYLLRTIYTSEGLRITRTVHRLVAEAYIPNPGNKPQINHKNGIKTDNRAANLEWCTAKENIGHAFAEGLRTSGNQGGSIHWCPGKNHWIGQIRHCGNKYRKVSINRAVVDMWLADKIDELEK